MPLRWLSAPDSPLPQRGQRHREDSLAYKPTSASQLHVYATSMQKNEVFWYLKSILCEVVDLHGLIMNKTSFLF